MARKRSHTRRTARSNPRGRLDMRRGGYGFVQTAEGEFFVPAKYLRGAFPDDVVEIAPVRRRDDGRRRGPGSGERRRVACVVRVIERAHEEVVGYFRHAEPFGVVEPVDPLIGHDIFTQLADNPTVPDGAIVRVAITCFPDRNTAATGQVLEVMGDEDDERVPIDLIVARHELETEFSDASIAQAADARVDERGALAEGYCDLRDRFIFTIDPVDARDFDDAVSLERVRCDLAALGAGKGRSCSGSPRFASPAGELHARRPPRAAEPAAAGREYWRLGVHIADVSHYVPWDCSIDLDARRRATSVYLVDRVVPMLPEALSNEICSLKPNEVRRTMTVDLYLDDAGEVVAADPYPALIRSRARLTYDQAQALIDGEGPTGVADPAVAELLQERVRRLSDIAGKRQARRERNGGLDFDTVEAKVRLDGAGHPVGIDLRQKTDATQLIEEAMIMANEAVARHLHDAAFPCIYRVHEQPAHDALEGLVPVLDEFDWFKRVNQDLFVAGDPHAVQGVLRAVEGRPEAALVTTLVLRSMKRAVYSPQLAQHYGLASGAYAHFTSPIRRYPDLVVHRMLRAVLFGRPEKFDQEVSNLPWLAEHSSEMERVAERAARESQDAKIVELMEEQVGQKFSALISGVATFGLFVRLDNTAEGVVEMADLGNEYFLLNPVRHMLTGSDTGKQYRLGRRIAVRLVEADRRTRQLRFRLA